MYAAVLRCSLRFQYAVLSVFPLISYGLCYMIRPYAFLCRKHISGLLFLSFSSQCLFAKKTKVLHLTVKGNEFQGGKTGNVTFFWCRICVFQNVLSTLSEEVVPTFTYSFFLRFVEQSTEPIIQPWCSLSYCVNYVQSYRGVWAFITTIFWRGRSAAARLAKQISQMTFRGV